MTAFPVPNVFDLEGERLADFESACATVAAEIRAAGLECTPAQVARGAQLGSLLEVATATRTNGNSKFVLSLAANQGACTNIVIGLEALGVSDPTPEQIAKFVSRLEVSLAGVEKTKTRPKLRKKAKRP